jgi:hypothetical protein
MNKVIGILSLAAALLTAREGLAQAQPAEQCPHCRAQLPDRHKFGMEWDRKPAPIIEVRLPAEAEGFITRWALLPERLERAASWTTFIAGGVTGALVYLAVSVGFILARIHK